MHVRRVKHVSRGYREGYMLRSRRNFPRYFISFLNLQADKACGCYSFADAQRTYFQSCPRRIHGRMEASVVFLPAHFRPASGRPEAGLEE